MSRLNKLLLSLSIAGASSVFADNAVDKFTESLIEGFKRESLELPSEQIPNIRAKLLTAHSDFCLNSGYGTNSKVRFAAVDAASFLRNSSPRTIESLEKIVKGIPCNTKVEDPGDRSPDWEAYYKETLQLSSNHDFLRLVQSKGFFPVKISWEDIGRWENSVWGDRISDVGIWVREKESDPSTAQLALSVRRDSNFSDKVLVVPTNNIKIHLKDGTKIKETTLLERLKDLGLTSKTRDDNVIVSNQFAIVPVPSKSMVSNSENPPRSAFTFSIFPYGSTNFVITDVIEGSHEAIVGPGTHQLLFANKNGERAPFTASRAEDRKDLLKLESDLKEKGMDVDVQRYYLVQIPLDKNAKDIELSNMGTPPLRYYGAIASLSEGAVGAPVPMSSNVGGILQRKGLDKVAIGTGDAEGPYNRGSGFRGKRAEEPIRVTVVYFVTPVGIVTDKDMETFSETFKSWDEKAVWGGSFVTKS